MKFAVEGDPSQISDPSKGLELRFAITWFGPDDQTVKLFRSLRLRSIIKQGTPGSLAPDERRLMQSYGQMLTEHLVSRLARGELQALGRLAGSMNLGSVPADWWRRVSVDLEANTAEAGGTTLQAVIVVETASMQPSSGLPGRPSSMHLIQAEFDARSQRAEIFDSLREESQHLSAWLSKQHPNVHMATAKTIENKIREKHRTWKANSPKAPKQ